jgi:hypothetical protein
MILRFLMDNYRMVRARLDAATEGSSSSSCKKEKDSARRTDGHLAVDARAVRRRSTCPSREIVNGRPASAAAPRALARRAEWATKVARSPTSCGDDDRGPERAVAAGELGSLVQEKLQAFAETLTDERERNDLGTTASSHRSRRALSISASSTVCRRNASARSRRAFKKAFADVPRGRDRRRDRFRSSTSATMD